MWLLCPATTLIDFYPRSPCGERLLLSLLSRAVRINFYPRSPCGERPAIDVFLAVWAVISIHALLAESDVSITITITCIALFLSTLSLRRATYLVRGRRPNWQISIHALLAESDSKSAQNSGALLRI